MQDTDKFDLEIRSMLTDAEEPVPAGAWEAVSGALDRKARRAAWIPVWRWTALGLAAAAAIAVGIFLFTPDQSIETTSDASMLAESMAPNSHHNSTPILLSDNSDSSEIRAGGVVSEGLSTPGQGPARADVPWGTDGVEGENNVPVHREGPVECKLSASPMTPQAMGAARSDAESFGDHSAGTSLESVITEDENVEVKKEENVAETQIEKPESEPESFDILNPEADLVKVVPQKERGRLAFVAGGNMESNASPSRSRFSGRRVSAMPKKGVTEQGDNSSYGIPLTLGVGLKWHFTPHWALGTGLNYSYLSRSFTGTYFDGTTVPVTAEIDNGIHYVGLPLNLYYQFSDTRPVQFYAFTGLTLEKGLQNRFRVKAASGDILYHENIDGVQLSFALGIGVGFRLTDHISLYLDPSLRYYLENGQPKSIRTAQPLMMSIEAGLRFDL